MVKSSVSQPFELIDSKKKVVPSIADFGKNHFIYKIEINVTSNTYKTCYSSNSTSLSQFMETHTNKTYFSSNLTGLCQFMETNNLYEIPDIIDDQNIFQSLQVNSIETEFSPFKPNFMLKKYQVPIIFGIEEHASDVYSIFSTLTLFTKTIETDKHVADPKATLEQHLEDATKVLERNGNIVIGGLVLGLTYYPIIDRSTNEILVKSANFI